LQLPTFAVAPDKASFAAAASNGELAPLLAGASLAAGSLAAVSVSAASVSFAEDADSFVLGALGFED
jgi:hypothetical protein